MTTEAFPRFSVSWLLQLAVVAVLAMPPAPAPAAAPEAKPANDTQAKPANDTQARPAIGGPLKLPRRKANEKRPA